MPDQPDNLSRLSVLGVRITNCTQRQAIAAIEAAITTERDYAHPLYIVNAHTLNLAAADHEYRDQLNDGWRVYGDGTGVRWAARQRGVEMLDNLVGTDLVPQLFESTAGRGYSYFLLGATDTTVARAADTCRALFPGWSLAGHHHGYVSITSAPEVVEKINEARPDVLLVAMGNPLQEQWIHHHKTSLKVPVAIGVGGLFDHWAGNLRRASPWVRRLGVEWLQILLQQPGQKWRRYILGNPLFLWRMTRAAAADRAWTANQCLKNS